MNESPDGRLTASDVAVGDTGPDLVVDDVDREDFVKYAGASGDFNPLHYDEPYARAARNESVFGQGMLTVGYVSTMVTNWFGINRVTTFGVRFQARVWPGDTITVKGEVTAVEEIADGAEVSAEVVAENQDGDAVVTGWVTAELPSG